MVDLGNYKGVSIACEGFGLGYVLFISGLQGGTTASKGLGL